MPSLADYIRLAPFELRELVAAANSVLRDRPRLHVAERTVRYYVTKGLLPGPSGPPKFARYDADHLLRLVATRALLDRGTGLTDARREVDELLNQEPESRVEVIQNLVTERERAPLNLPSKNAPFRQEAVVVTRMPLGSGVTLDVPSDLEWNEDIEDAVARLRDALENA